MQHELALQKVNELREVVDGETEELVDALATLFILRQDMSNPMYGAKVTYHQRPEFTSYKAPEEEIPEGLADWQVPYSVDKPERWEKWSFPWLNGEPSEEPETVVRVDIKDNEDDPDIIERRAIVFDPSIAEGDPDMTYWDPNLKEYTSPSDYPMGTVNIILPDDDDREFEKDYVYGVKVETSVTPADGDPRPHEYTPGW